MDDLAGALMEQGWPALVLPAIADQDADFDLGGGVFHHRSKGDLLQDGWDSLEDLEHVRRTAGSHVFSAQYQQQPLPPEGNMVKCDWLKTYKSAPKLGECRHVYLACDPSGAVGSNNDYTAIVVAAVAERKVHLLEVRRGHWECLEISRHLREMADHWKPTQIMIETTGMGEAVRQLIDRTHKYDIRGIQQKIDKITRLSRVIARFESNQVLLPREADWLDDFMKEILAFPNGRNDDQVDALLMVLEDLSKREQSEDSIPSIVFPDMWRENPFSADRFTNHGY